MAYSYVEYTGTTNTDYNLNFAGPDPGYLSQDHVGFYLNGVLQNNSLRTFVSDQIVRIAAPLISDTVRFRRESNLSLPMVDWTSGAGVSSSNLDTDTAQMIYLDQEAKDRLDEAVLGDYTPGTTDEVAITWYTAAASDPSTSWTGSDASHEGDWWFTTDSKVSYRWSGTAWVLWTESIATTALANASTAQDTADGKRRYFTGLSTPLAPYDIGDIWVKINSVYKTTSARTLGNEYAGDWLIKAADETNSAPQDLDWVVGSLGTLTVSGSGGIVIADGGDLELQSIDDDNSMLTFRNMETDNYFDFKPYGSGDVLRLLPRQVASSLWLGDYTNTYGISSVAYQSQLIYCGIPDGIHTKLQMFNTDDQVTVGIYDDDTNFVQYYLHQDYLAAAGAGTFASTNVDLGVDTATGRWGTVFAYDLDIEGGSTNSITGTTSNTIDCIPSSGTINTQIFQTPGAIDLKIETSATEIIYYKHLDDALYAFNVGLGAPDLGISTKPWGTVFANDLDIEGGSTSAIKGSTQVYMQAGDEPTDYAKIGCNVISIPEVGFALGDGGGSNAMNYKFFESSFEPRNYGTYADPYLGTSTYYWGRVYADTYYYKTGSSLVSFDALDDLQVLDDMGPVKDKDGKPIKEGRGFKGPRRRDLHPVVTNIDTLSKTFKDAHDVDLTEDELISILKEESPAIQAGDTLIDADFIDSHLFNDTRKETQLSFGAIRQLNKEVTEDVMEQVNDMFEFMLERISNLEAEVSALKGK